MSLQDDARTLFTERFFAPPQVLLRVPGRVILAGEHTDISLLPLLGMAIDREIVIAASDSTEPGVQAISAGFEGEANIEPRKHSAHGWTKQLEAALAETDTRVNRGAKIAIVSNLPAGAGLASSAAVMTGVLAAMNQLWNLGWSRDEIASKAASAERKLGIETTGADHVILASSEVGQALHLDMQPVAQVGVPIPAEWTFVLASPPEVPERAELVRRLRNERIVGLRMASAMLAEMIGLDPNQTLILGDVAGTDVVDLLADELPVKQTIKEVARATDVLPARLGALSHSQFETQVLIPVRGPAVHILSEAERVAQFEAALAADDPKAAGVLFVHSHTSLRDDYLASSAALNEIVKSMGKAGAYGAKTTGFGGQVLAIVPAEALDAVIAAALAAGATEAAVVRPAAGWSLL